MKTSAIFSTLLATAAVVSAEWSYTWTGPSGGWTSATSEASAIPTETAWGSKPVSEGISTTCYSATYSSGTSTWAVPETISYSVASSWTSMIPPPSSAAPTSAAAVSSYSATSSLPAAYTGGAVANAAGVGAMAVAGLAMML